MSRMIALLLLLASFPAASRVWFEVAEIETDRNQSFLLALDDPEHIAQARQLIAQGRGGEVGSIVLARIAAGGDGFNRDLRSPQQRLWSWRIVSFDGFADLAIELCDGGPGWVEDDPHGFIANTGGRICFWGYTVVAELATPPAFLLTEGMDGAWYNPAHSGQGLFIDVLGGSGQVSFGWFTYAEGAPATSTGEHRWYTALGPRNGASADLVLYDSHGGAFDRADPVNTEPVGTAQLLFQDCDSGELRYAFDGGASGSISLQRVASRPGCIASEREVPASQ